MEIKGNARCAGVVKSQKWNKRCVQNASYHEDGNTWCGIHAPSQVENRKRLREIRTREERAKKAQQAAEQKRDAAAWRCLVNTSADLNKLDLVARLLDMLGHQDTAFRLRLACNVARRLPLGPDSALPD